VKHLNYIFLKRCDFAIQKIYLSSILADIFLWLFLKHRDNKIAIIARCQSLRKKARGKGTRVEEGTETELVRGGRVGEYEKLTCPRAEAVEPGCWG